MQSSEITGGKTYNLMTKTATLKKKKENPRELKAKRE